MSNRRFSGQPSEELLNNKLPYRASCMGKKSLRNVRLADYVAEVLKNALYEKGEQLDVIVAEAPDLPGCLTQGATFEEARENLLDAIEVWLLSGLRSGELCSKHRHDSR